MNKKATGMKISYNWICNEEQKKILDRANRALKIATLQVEFWKSEVKFWQERLKIKQYNAIFYK